MSVMPEGTQRGRRQQRQEGQIYEVGQDCPGQSIGYINSAGGKQAELRYPQ
jgi:hypothetical protein